MPTWCSLGSLGNFAHFQIQLKKTDYAYTTESHLSMELFALLLSRPNQTPTLCCCNFTMPSIQTALLESQLGDTYTVLKSVALTMVQAYLNSKIGPVLVLALNEHLPFNWFLTKNLTSTEPTVFQKIINFNIKKIFFWKNKLHYLFHLQLYGSDLLLNWTNMLNPKSASATNTNLPEQHVMCHFGELNLHIKLT